MIEDAYKRLQGHARKTPLLSSPFLDEISGRRVFVKAECLQHTGSFKFRGAWNAISTLTEEEKAREVLALSSGNHAQGIAAAAKAHGVKATVLMPSDAPTVKIENTRFLGANVVTYDRATQDRDEVAAKMLEEKGYTLIHPFNNPKVIGGQGTVGLEIAEQADEFGINDAEVLVPCGGGGLMSGVATALEARKPKFKVRPVEPEGFDDVTRSLATGKLLANEKTSGSICDAIMTPCAGDLTFPIIQKLCGSGIVVSDEDALRAMALAFKRLRIVIEPGGAVALAAALFHANKINSETVICVASGGNTDPDVFQRALALDQSSLG
ncbi:MULTISPECIES: threonine/serine dehydratase [Halocynthiibacter]|uniref:Threonine/serine dehydratase n=1 Tax=Halocynthiibacter halioticoli TaxID=2986804 RepID=A0AAE3J0D0_9RHOB|nr:MULTISPECIES: threonine/serine dehydratase [Halocynthiibacter]MCV6825339.1 threonine/serine dehydratase [Halocynthiibacter halioticoli]MCW4058340.1 threonine/serine dehydratase [Halocynthiibacter sp. SDUM655004]